MAERAGEQREQYESSTGGIPGVNSGLEDNKGLVQDGQKVGSSVVPDESVELPSDQPQNQQPIVVGTEEVLEEPAANPSIIPPANVSGSRRILQAGQTTPGIASQITQEKLNDMALRNGPQQLAPEVEANETEQSVPVTMSSRSNDDIAPSESNALDDRSLFNPDEIDRFSLDTAFNYNRNRSNENRSSEQKSDIDNAPVENTEKPNQETNEEALERITTARAAQLLGVTQNKVRKLISNGELKANKQGRSWIIANDSIDNYLASNPKLNLDSEQEQTEQEVDEVRTSDSQDNVRDSRSVAPNLTVRANENSANIPTSQNTGTETNAQNVSEVTGVEGSALPSAATTDNVGGALSPLWLTDPDVERMIDEINTFTDPPAPNGFENWDTYYQYVNKVANNQAMYFADMAAVEQQREVYASIIPNPFDPKSVKDYDKLDSRAKALAIKTFEQQEAEKVATARNKMLNQIWIEWKNNPVNKDRDNSEYPDVYKEDFEGFEYYANPDYEHGRTRKEQEEGRERVEPGKISRARDRIVNSFIAVWKKGWFPIDGFYIDENNEIMYPPEVENAMANLKELFNLRGIQGDRTVFRLVMWYASISNDRSMKMFNGKGDWGDWSLTADEFCNIAECIELSCMLYGTPNMMPEQVTGRRLSLHGTEIIPSGVLPKSLARELTKNGSIINKKWGINDPVDLIERCQDQWMSTNLPYMQKNLTGDKIAQRIVIEDMQVALYRMDGLSTDAFYEAFGIDTSAHYTIRELEDSNITYASATNGKWHSDEVVANNEQALAKYEDQARKQSGRIRRFGRDSTGRFHFGTQFAFDDNNKPPVAKISSGAKLLTNWVKFNNLVFRLPIIISAIPEAGLNVALSSASLRIVGGKQNISEASLEKVFSEEGLEALDAMKTLYDIGGAGAIRLFTEHTKTTQQPMSRKAVLDFLQDKYLVSNPQLVTKANRLMSKLESAVLAGDRIFSTGDLKNWFNGFLVHNQLQMNSIEKIDNGQREYRDTAHNIAFTIDEIEDAIAAHSDIRFFFSEIAGTDAGISAFASMRGHNINQVNPASAFVQSWLSRHGISNFMITTFLDHFPTYGINFAINMVPLSRTWGYLLARGVGQNIMGSSTAGDMVMGGNLSSFWEGLKLNLIYDCVQIGRWGATGLFMGAILLLLGFDLPDDDENAGNHSFYKIGSNLGWGPDTDGDGKGNGIEIEWGFFMNDLMQWGSPIAYGIAGAYRFGPEVGTNILLDSLAASFDGNVMLDTVNLIQNWGDILFDYEEMSKNVNYTGSDDPWSYAIYCATDTLYNGIKYFDPTTAISQMIENSALIRGNMARRKDPSKVFDHSTPFRESAGITKYVDSMDEYLARKNFKNSFLIATVKNFVAEMNEGDTYTGYNWWEMPNKTHSDERFLVWADRYYMDYSNIPDGMNAQQYEHFMANTVLNDIKENWGHYNSETGEWTFDYHQAINDGYCITSAARDALKNDIIRQQQQIMNEYYNADNSGVFTVSGLKEYKNGLWQQYNKLKEFADNWVYNKDLPEFGVYYEQILTNFEPVYIYADSGKPAFAGRFMKFFDPNIEVKWKPKGDHPVGIAPWTVTDYSDDGIDRGWSGETHPYYYQEGETGTDVDALREWGEDKEIKLGRNQGEIFSDVTFGKQLTGEYAHPNDPTVERADVPVVRRVGDVNGYEPDSNVNATGDSSNATASAIADNALAVQGNSQNLTGSSADNGTRKSSTWEETPGAGSKNTLAGDIDTSNSTVPGNTLSPDIKNSNAKNTGLDGGVYGETAAFNQDAYDLFFGITKPKTSYGNGSGSNGRTYSTYYGYSTKSYDYMPKIYSNSRTLNSDRASTMNTPRPYNANKTYLNPSFETKGSRESYKRQDI